MQQGQLLRRWIFSSLILLLLPFWLAAYSYVRVVRLSLVDGAVHLTRPGESHPERGLVNLPLVQDAVLETENGLAEVEFESEAFARLANNTRLSFAELALRENGGRVNVLTLEQGTATFSVRLRDDDTFIVQTPYVQVRVPERARFRIDLTSSGTRVRVFSGEVHLEGNAGPLTLSKGRMFEWNQDSQRYVLTRNPQPDGWDEWNNERDSALDIRGPQAVPAHLRYGLYDMHRYGHWFYLGHFGYVWRPWVAAGWLPFSYGSWAWYPGFGWTWVSFEPWGWLPYHFGYWYYDPFWGWVWVPGAFQSWSPARCYWARQPGWIGWGPLPPEAQPRNQIPADSSQPPPPILVVSEEGFGRDEMPRLAREVDGGQWTFVSELPAELTEAVLRARRDPAVRQRRDEMEFDPRAGGDVNRAGVALPSPESPRTGTRTAPAATEERSASPVARRPFAGGRDASGDTESAQPVRLPRPNVPANPGRYGEAPRGAAKSAPGERSQPAPDRGGRVSPAPASGNSSSRPAAQPSAPRPAPAPAPRAPQASSSPRPAASSGSSAPASRPAPPPKPSPPRS